MDPFSSDDEVTKPVDANEPLENPNSDEFYKEDDDDEDE